MTKHACRLMDKIEFRLNKLIGMEVTACGHDENIDKADRYRTQMVRFIYREIEALCEKAGVE